MKDEILIVNTLGFLLSDMKRDDIVMFRSAGKLLYPDTWTHRVIALEGDTVVVKNNKVYVNNELHMYPDLEQAKNRVLTVPEGKVYQKGDNKNTTHGLVDKKLIMGNIFWHGNM